MQSFSHSFFTMSRFFYLQEYSCKLIYLIIFYDFSAPGHHEGRNKHRPHGMTRNLLTKIKCFLSLGEIIVHPNLGALNKPSLTMVKKNYSSSTFAFIGILPLPGHSRFVKIYLTLQSLTAFCFSLRPPSSGYSCIRHYLLVPYGF